MYNEKLLFEAKNGFMAINYSCVVNNCHLVIELLRISLAIIIAVNDTNTICMSLKWRK